LGELRDSLESRIQSEIGGVLFNSSGAQRVANTLNVAFEGLDGETLLINLDNRGFAISSGAVCSSGSQEPSPVLRAMGSSNERASSSLRISLGWTTTAEEVAQFFEALKAAVANMREVRAKQLEGEEGFGLWQSFDVPSVSVKP
jgi:cysteine desulfurase